MKKINLFFCVFSLFLCMALTSCSSTPMMHSQALTVPKDFFGLVHAGRTIEDYPLLNEMRAVWILHTFYWNQIERQQGVFNFSTYDNIVNIAKQNNKKIIAILAYTPSWIDKRNGKIDYLSKNDIPDFLNYVEATVSRYKGKIDAWQIWNEPNFIFWRGTDNEFYELSRLTTLKIREIDPNAYIVGGGFHCSSFHWVPKKFIINMHKAGAMEHLDALSFHPYGFVPLDSIKMHDDFLNIIKEINFTGDILITENGYPTSGYYPSSVSLKKFPAYIVKTIAGTAARAPKVLMWYQFSDKYNIGEYPNKTNSEFYFGLNYFDYTRKAGSWAFQLCATYLPGSQYNPELPKRENISSGIISFFFSGNAPNSNTLIIWNDRSGAKKVRITADSPITLHNISTGTNIVLPDRSVLDITNEPVFITWQGSSKPLLTGVSK